MVLTKITVYLLTNKNQALNSLQLFVGLTAIPFGGRIVRWRADQGGEYTGERFQQYCLETGKIQGFAATNTPQQIGVSERVERTMCAMVGCMLADSGFPSSMWGELFMMAAFLKNRTPHKALKMELAIQDTLRREERPLAPLRHRIQNLRAHERLHKAQRRGLGREGVRL